MGEKRKIQIFPKFYAQILVFIRYTFFKFYNRISFFFNESVCDSYYTVDCAITLRPSVSNIRWWRSSSVFQTVHARHYFHLFFFRSAEKFLLINPSRATDSHRRCYTQQYDYSIAVNVGNICRQGKEISRQMCIQQRRDALTTIVYCFTAESSNRTDSDGVLIEFQLAVQCLTALLIGLRFICEKCKFIC